MITVGGKATVAAVAVVGKMEAEQDSPQLYGSTAANADSFLMSTKLQ